MDGTQTFADEQNWFVATEPASGVFAIHEPLHYLDVRSHLVIGSERAILVDTGTGVGNIRKIVDSITALPVTVVNSHAHWDHIGGNWQFDDIAIHSLEADGLDIPESTDKLRASCVPERLRGPLPPGVTQGKLEIRPSKATRLLQGGERFELGGRTIETIHAPGHSPGLLALIDRAAGVLMSTDVVEPGYLFAQFDDCDLEAYLQTLDALSELAPQLNLVLPYHTGGGMPVGMILEMRNAMEEVLNGRRPEEVGEEQAIHHFDGFGICVPPDYRGRPAL